MQCKSSLELQQLQWIPTAVLQKSVSFSYRYCSINYFSCLLISMFRTAQTHIFAKMWLNIQLPFVIRVVSCLHM